MLNPTARVLLIALVLAAVACAADISGAWQFSLVTPTTKGSPSFVFKQDGEKLTGTYSGKFGQAELSGAVTGDQVEFTFESQSSKFHYKGTIEGTGMKGEFEKIGTEKGTFTGVRK